MIRLKRVIIAFAVVAMSGCVQTEMAAPKPMRETKAPLFTLADHDGVERAYTKGPAVINFWATWCMPCVKELPLIERLYRAEKDGEVQVIGVNVKESPEVVASFIRKKGYTFPTALDLTGATVDDYQVFGLPSTYFIDKNGMIVKKHMGELNGELLHEGLSLIAP